MDNNENDIKPPKPVPEDELRRDLVLATKALYYFGEALDADIEGDQKRYRKNMAKLIKINNILVPKYKETAEYVNKLLEAEEKRDRYYNRLKKIQSEREEIADELDVDD